MPLYESVFAIYFSNKLKDYNNFIEIIDNIHEINEEIQKLIIDILRSKLRNGCIELNNTTFSYKNKIFAIDTINDRREFTINITEYDSKKNFGIPIPIRVNGVIKFNLISLSYPKILNRVFYDLISELNYFLIHINSVLELHFLELYNNYLVNQNNLVNSLTSNLYNEILPHFKANNFLGFENKIWFSLTNLNTAKFVVPFSLEKIRDTLNKLKLDQNSFYSPLEMIINLIIKEIEDEAIELLREDKLDGYLPFKDLIIKKDPFKHTFWVAEQILFGKSIGYLYVAQFEEYIVSLDHHHNYHNTILKLITPKIKERLQEIFANNVMEYKKRIKSQQNA